MSVRCNPGFNIAARGRRREQHVGFDTCDAGNYKVERQADGTVLLRMTGGMYVGGGAYRANANDSCPMATSTASSQARWPRAIDDSFSRSAMFGVGCRATADEDGHCASPWRYSSCARDRLGVIPVQRLYACVNALTSR